MPAATQIPDMHLMSIFAGEEKIRLQSVFDHLRRAPFATQQRIETQMPPEIVMQKLWAPIHLPLTQDFERLTIEHENTARTVAIGGSESANVNAFRPAVNRMRTRIVSASKNFFRLDHFHDLRFSRIGLDVDNVNARRANSRHNKVTALDVGVGRIGAKRRTARVPPEMMQFITKLRHLDLADLSAIATRARINVDYQKGVVEFACGRIKRRYERIFLRRPSHGQPRRRIKRRVWL